MPHDSSAREERYRDLLNANPAVFEGLPTQERRIAEQVARGERVAFVANDESISEEAVWHLLERLARAVTGTQTPRPVETGGLGSDTDPGVSGGYGETGFGSISSDVPYMTDDDDPGAEPPRRG